MIPLHHEHRKYSQKQFLNEKRQTLCRVDRSIKGSIDEPIYSLVNLINSSPNFYTTSSCSGRIIIISSDTFQESSAKNKKNWNFITHSLIDDPDDLVQSLFDTLKTNSSIYSSTLKFEPFILHVRCLSLESACKLLHCSIESGQRNSGLMISNSGHFTIAIRNSLNLEVPLIVDGHLVIDKEYLRILMKIANEKMRENFQKIQRFETNCQIRKIFQDELEIPSLDGNVYNGLTK